MVPTRAGICGELPLLALRVVQRDAAACPELRVDRKCSADSRNGAFDPERTSISARTKVFLGTELARHLRRECSRPLIFEMEAWLREQHAKLSKDNDTTSAISHYPLRRIQAL